MNLNQTLQLKHWLKFLLILVLGSCNAPKQIVATADLTFKPEDFSIKITTTKLEKDEQNNKWVCIDFEIKNLTSRDFHSQEFNNDRIYLKVNIVATDNEVISFEKNLSWYESSIPAGTLKTYSFETIGPNKINIGKRNFKSISISLFHKNY